MTLLSTQLAGLRPSLHIWPLPTAGLLLFTPVRPPTPCAHRLVGPPGDLAPHPLSQPAGSPPALHRVCSSCPTSPTDRSSDWRAGPVQPEAASSEERGRRGGHGLGGSCCFIFHSHPAAYVVMAHVHGHFPARSQLGPRGNSVLS